MNQRSARNPLGNYNIIALERGDVNGDRVPDTVFLTGDKTQDSPHIQNITLMIQDGRTGKITQIPLKENSGYNPVLFLGSFVTTDILDILIIINTGGSGATTNDYLYSFRNNVPKLLFDSDIYNNTYQYKIGYRDHYLVEAMSLNNRTRYLISILLKGKDYLGEIYRENGHLRGPIEGFVNPLSSLFPVDVDQDGIYELMAFQKIAGRYNADSLGYFQNFLRWEEGGFTLFNQYVSVLGAEH